MSGGDDHDLRLDGVRSTGVWGAVMGAVSVGAILFFLLYAYYYLDLSNEPFIPERMPTPPVLLPAVLIGGLALTVVPNVSLFGATVRRDTSRIAVGAAVLALAGGAFVVLGGLVVRGQDLQPSQDAYSASVVLLLGFHGLATAIGITMAAYVAYQALRMLDHPWLLSASSVLVVWWSYVILGWLAVGFSIYGYPQLATGAT